MRVDVGLPVHQVGHHLFPAVHRRDVQRGQPARPDQVDRDVPLEQAFNRLDTPVRRRGVQQRHSCFVDLVGFQQFWVRF
jgi:hypothetical protein